MLLDLDSYWTALVLHSGFVNCMSFLRANKMNQNRVGRLYGRRRSMSHVSVCIYLMSAIIIDREAGPCSVLVSDRSSAIPPCPVVCAAAGATYVNVYRVTWPWRSYCDLRQPAVSRHVPFTGPRAHPLPLRQLRTVAATWYDHNRHGHSSFPRIQSLSWQIQFFSVRN